MSQTSVLVSQIQSLADKCGEMDKAIALRLGAISKTMEETNSIVVSNPSFSLSTAAQGLPMTFTVSAESLLTPAQPIAKFVISSDILNIANREVVATNNTASITLDIPATLAEGSTLDVSIFAIDELDNRSGIITNTTIVVKGRIITPSITSPSSNASIEFNGEGVALASSAFLTQFVADTHKSTTWKITSDVTGQIVVAEHTSTTNLTRYTFTGLNLNANQTYYAFVTYEGNALGISATSQGVAFVAKLAVVTKPSISSPIDNSDIVTNDTGITVVTSNFTVSSSSDTHVSTDYKITSDINGVSVVAQALASSDLTSHTFSASSLSSLINGATYYIWVRHNGSAYGSSVWSEPVAFTVNKAFIATPTITAPASNGNIYFTVGVTLKSTAFVTTNATGTHISSDWGIYSDAACTTVISEALNSSDLLSHTFTGLDLTDDAIYYVRCRHNSAEFGSSAWSAPVACIARLGFVDIPTISSPTANETVVPNANSLTIVGSAFSVTGSEDTQASMKVRICSDSTGTNILASKTISGSTTSITLDVADMTNITDGTKYIQIAYEGTNLSWSGWSNPVAITVTNAYVNTPSIVSPSANDIVYNLVGITVNSSTFAVTNATDTHESTDWQICSDSECTVVVAEALASNDKTSYTFSDLELADNTTYYLRVRYTGATFGTSEWSIPVAVLNKTAYLNPPVITTPTNNQSIHLATEGITIGSSLAFNANIEDTHSATKFSISRDIEGDNIVATYTTPEGTGEGWTITASGRKIARHWNGEGSVIQFDMFGKTVNLFVADAQYRNKLQFASGGFNSSLTNFGENESSNSGYLTESSVLRGQTDEPPVITDTQLQAMWSTGTVSIKDDLTARQNCDVWMANAKSNGSDYAVPYARSLTSFDGIADGCDIPNIYELMVIFIEMNYIDALDPTIPSYQSYALGNTAGVSGKRWNFNGSGYAFSSSENATGQVRAVRYNTSCKYGTTTSTYGITPVRELTSFYPDGLKYHHFHASTVGNIAENTTLYARMSYEGTILGYSEESVVPFVNRSHVIPPTIISPLDGDLIKPADGLTVILDEFSYVGTTGVSQSSVQVDVCSDSEGNNILATKIAYGIDNVVTFSGSELLNVPGNTTSYIVAYRTGTTISRSDKSQSVPIIRAKTLEECTWSEIQAIGASGLGANYFDIGDIKSIILNGTVGAVEFDNSTAYVFIIEFNYCGDNGIYFQGFKSSDGTKLLVLDDSYYDSTKVNGILCFNFNHWGSDGGTTYTYGGWKGCDLRYDILGSTNIAPSDYGTRITGETNRIGYDAPETTPISPVPNTLMAALPVELRTAIAPWTIHAINVSRIDGNTVFTAESSIDYLPLLAHCEFNGEVSNHPSDVQVTAGHDDLEEPYLAQMSYYSNGNTLRNDSYFTVSDNDTENRKVLTRTIQSNVYCRYVSSSYGGLRAACDPLSILPAFRIA